MTMTMPIVLMETQMTMPIVPMETQMTMPIVCYTNVYLVFFQIHASVPLEIFQWYVNVYLVMLYQEIDFHEKKFSKVSFYFLLATLLRYASMVKLHKNK